MIKMNSAGPAQTPPQGGFLTSPGKSGTPVPTNYDRQRDFMRNVVPVTVAQIWKAEDDEIKIGNSPARILSLVGKLKCIERSSASLTFILDDMTGAPIEAKLWLGFDEKIPDEVASFSTSFPYAHVIGTLRCIQKKRFLHVTRILPIKEANEITMHLLEVIHSSMSVLVKEQMEHATNDQLDIIVSWNPQGNVNVTVPHCAAATNATYQSVFLNSNNFGTPNTALASPKTPQSTVAKPIPAVVQGLNKEQTMVLKVISDCKSSIGVGYDCLFFSLKSLNKHAILQAVDFLSNEGHIYNTIDDEHFLATDDELKFT